MEAEKVIFVFYTLKSSDTWKYSKIPKGWWWIGSGSTNNPKYAQEEQFQGPEKTKTAMLMYLNMLFNDLKQKGIVKNYKIRRSYLP